MTRANSPATRHEQFLELLMSRNQAQAPWTDKELAAALYCSERTVQRYREWLRDTGRFPLPLKMAGQPPSDPTSVR